MRDLTWRPWLSPYDPVADMSLRETLSKVAAGAGRSMIEVDVSCARLRELGPERRKGSNPSSNTAMLVLGARAGRESTGNTHAVLLVDGDQVRIRSRSLEEDVASAKVRLSKTTAETRRCLCCMRPGLAHPCTCRRCWSSVCEDCLCKIQLRNEGGHEYRCPVCSATHPLDNLATLTGHTRISTGSSPMECVRRAVQDMGRQRTQICVEAKFDTGAVRIDCRCSCSVQLMQSGRISFDCADRKRIVKLLKTAGTIFSVGELPTGPDDLRDLLHGHVFETATPRSALRIRRAFATVVVRMRAQMAR